MPTVLRDGGYVVKIYFNDHEPAHVHVIQADGEAIVTLDPVVVLRFWGFSRRQLAKAVEIVDENRTNLLRDWREIHGDQRP
jgi:hypothetical protein